MDSRPAEAPPLDPRLQRVIGVAAHVDAGKTTLCERLLFDAQVERRMGEVEEGTTVLDWMKQERERGITIAAAATSLPWKGARIELVDTPGHVDFGIEVDRALLALDALVVVVDVLAGVQARTESVWRAATQAGLARCLFLNKLDRAGADPARLLTGLAERLQARLLPISWPHEEGGTIVGVVDLFDLSIVRASTRSSRARRDPAACQADLTSSAAVAVSVEAQVLHQELLECLAEGDESLLEDVVAGRQPDPARLRSALRARVCSGELVPLLCGSALLNVGVHTLLDALVDLAPSPLDRPVRRARSKDGALHPLGVDPLGPLCAQVFKLQRLAQREVAFVRVHEGALRVHQQVELAHAGGTEHITGIFRAHGEHLEPLASASAGSIVAVTGLTRAHTGETLGASGAVLALPSLDLPQPVVSCLVEPPVDAQRAPLRALLQWLVREDPTLRLGDDVASGSLVLAGMGELHLDVAMQRIRDETGIEAKAGAPQVAYLESVQSSGTALGTIDRLHGDERIQGAAEVSVVAMPHSERPVVSFAPECVFDPSTRVAVQEALDAELQAGPRLGLPLTALRVVVCGRSPTVDSASRLGAVLAAREGLARALAAAGSAVLEPWVRFEVRTPSSHAALLQGELMGRGVEIEEVLGDGTDRLVRGRAPLYATFGFARGLRSLSQGRADFTLAPVGHAVLAERELAARGL